MDFLLDRNRQKLKGNMIIYKCGGKATHYQQSSYTNYYKYFDIFEKQNRYKDNILVK